MATARVLTETLSGDTRRLKLLEIKINENFFGENVLILENKKDQLLKNSGRP